MSGFCQHFYEIHSWFVLWFRSLLFFIAVWFSLPACHNLSLLLLMNTWDASSFVTSRINLLRTFLDIFCWVHALISVLIYPRVKLLGHTLSVSLASRYRQKFFWSGRTNLHSLHRCTRAQFALHPYWDFVLSVFLILVIPVAMYQLLLWFLFVFKLYS